ncbi:chromosomal replication initiator protein DnaA [Verrucomicrobiota bacterium]
MDKKQATKLWQDTCKRLHDILSKDIYERWIAVISFKSFEGNTFYLSVENDFYMSWLEENYIPLIRNALTTVSGETYDITLSVDAPDSQEPKPEKAPRKTKAKKEVTKNANNSNLKESYTFNDFIIGPSNSFSHAAAMAVAQSPSKAYNPLFIYGSTGLGKTHLMQAIGNHVVSSNSSKKVRYLSCETFINEYIDALQKRTLTKFRNKYRNVDVLLLDDVHFLIGKQQMQEEFFHTFNALHNNHKQIILTCDRPASELSQLQERLISRFEWGLVTELQIPDIETRIAIIRQKAEDMNLKLPDELMVFLAERISANIRRLEGALIRVASYVSLMGREIDRTGIEHLLKDTLDQEQAMEVTVESIQRIVADHFSIGVADILSKKRPKNIAWPRQIAMYLTRSMTEHSLPVIGESFGGRNHATVLHAYNSVSGKIEADDSLRQTIGVLKQKIDKKLPAQ